MTEEMITEMITVRISKPRPRRAQRRAGFGQARTTRDRTQKLLQDDEDGDGP
jgi:hypothetical protein